MTFPIDLTPRERYLLIDLCDKVTRNFPNEKLGYIGELKAIQDKLFAAALADAPKPKPDYVQEQRDWIAEHGGNLAGYIARYGSAADEQHYGDGGEAIWRADMARLVQLQKEAR